MWSSRPSLKKMWGCVHHLQRDLCRLIRAAGRCCWEAAGGVQLSPCVPKRPLYLGTRAREQGGPWPLASFYLRFTNVGCKTWIAICTKRKVKLFPPPLDLRASHSNPFSRRLSSCAQRNITLVLKPSGGLVCRLLNNEGKKKKRASLTFAMVFSFTNPCWSGSAVFSTYILDKAQFFMWSETMNTL